MKEITSPTNPTFKMFKSLTASKGIKKEGLCLASGQHILKEIEKLKLDYKSIHFEESKDPDYLLPKDLFNALTPLKSLEPIFLVPTPELPIEGFKNAPQGLEVLLPAGDPKNIGALIRTCLAFDVTKIILLEEASNPFLPEAIKASSGNVFKAPLFKGPTLKNLNIENLYALDAKGAPIKEAKLSKKPLRLLIGEEGGFASELKTKSLSIPISDKVESLNVNSCLSIALYELQS